MRMTKKHYAFLAQKVECQRTGKKAPRKSGGIATKPTVPCEKLLEAVVLKNCLSWLHSRGVLADRLNNGLMRSSDGERMNRYGIAGAGDIIACFRGLHIEIECKAGKGGTLSLIQQKRKEAVEDAEGIYLIVHGVPELAVQWNEKVMPWVRRTPDGVLWECTK